MRRIEYKGFCITIEEIRTQENGPVVGYAVYIRQGVCHREYYGARVLNPEGGNVFNSSNEAEQYTREWIDNMTGGPI